MPSISPTSAADLLQQTNQAKEATPTKQAKQANASSDGGLQGLQMDDFLTLLIAELQNQDPMSPMENSEMLQQIGMIRDIGATDKLSDTLSTMNQGQQLTTASGMIGKSVVASGENGSIVKGVVDKVSIEIKDSTQLLKLHIGDQTINISDVQEIIGGTAAVAATQ